MIMKIEKIKFEGTPEEFKAIDYVFTDNSSHAAGAEYGEKDISIDPKDAYRAMLRRRRISNGQREVYETLADGELDFEEYLNKMGRTSSQIAGVHGALGRRINNTEEIHKAGLPGNLEAIIKWRKEGERDFLSLNPDFLEVLEDEGII
jgi:hypothetical protein